MKDSSVPGHRASDKVNSHFQRDSGGHLLANLNPTGSEQDPISSSPGHEVIHLLDSAFPKDAAPVAGLSFGYYTQDSGMLPPVSRGRTEKTIFSW